MTTDRVELPDSFALLAAPLPPMLAALCGHHGVSRFFCLFYASKATWSDGWRSGTFSYRAAYQPLVEHPAIALSLADADLGSDDGPPRHALLCDRQTARMYVGGYEQVEEFLRAQTPRPPALTPEESEAQRCRSARMTPAEMREAGMFEFLFGPSPEQHRLGGELVAWLDRFITPELLRQYHEAWDGGDLVAMSVLLGFARRFEQARRRARGDEAGTDG